MKTNKKIEYELLDILYHKSKEEIKREVIAELKPIYNSMFEGIDFSSEGSLSETYYYMSMPNVMKILESCFEKTYNKIISNENE